MIEVAELYRVQGHYGKAEPLARKAEEMARRVFRRDHKIISASVNNLIKLYEDWGKPEKTQEWREEGTD